MKISILTLFPKMFQGPFDYSIVKRAIDRRLVTIEFINIRDFGIGRHKTVDDKPYGGGKGMILRADVLYKTIEKTKRGSKNTKVVLLDPKGKRFNQKKAINFSKLEHLIFVCGHYEGIDTRVEEFVDEKISIGDFITTGGEIPAMLITDAVVRLVKGVLKNGVTEEESFSPYLPRPVSTRAEADGKAGLPRGPLRSEASKAGLEHPQYTKPRRFKNLRVPNILLSGNHKKIEKWQNTQSIKSTIKSRPDLIKNKLPTTLRSGF